MVALRLTSSAFSWLANAAGGFLPSCSAFVAPSSSFILLKGGLQRWLLHLHVELTPDHWPGQWLDAQHHVAVLEEPNRPGRLADGDGDGLGALADGSGGGVARAQAHAQREALV